MDRSVNITNLVNQGYSSRKIGLLEGITSNTVQYWVKKLNLKLKLSEDDDGYRPPKHSDCIGKTFGYLRIKGFQRHGSRGSYNAICDCLICGKETVKNFPNILRSTVTSCGCRRDQYDKLKGENSSQYTGFFEISGCHWAKIKNGAIKRGISFNIDIEFAWDLFLKQDRKCALTGIELSFGVTNNSIDKEKETASLDRIDSKKHYTKDNVQWIHKDVNIMKNMLEQDYFIALCKRIAINCEIGEGFEDDSIFSRRRFNTSNYTYSDNSHM